jgi:hypothetical protein
MHPPLSFHLLANKFPQPWRVNGWPHSDVASAFAHAHWLSSTLGFPIRFEGDQ